uniref:Multidrug resistance protein 1-like n=1 Tax=Phallusia mammillata TaxID=59560 RepID=A0A6F9D4W5_9ASCI|nr:multidrug resistance protein 1-like [Phallusia mammillata]
MPPDTVSTAANGMPEKVSLDNLSEKKSEGNGEEEKKKEIPSIAYSKLFRYATAFDWLLIVFGTLSAGIHGAGLPVMFIFFGELTTLFTEYGTYELCGFNYTACTAMNLTNLTESGWNDTVVPIFTNFREETVKFVYYFVYIACAVVVLGSFQVTAWSAFAVRQTAKIRTEYFRSILRQDIGYHDVTSSGELNARLSSDIKKIRDGLAEKVSMVVQYLSMTLSGLIIGFVYAWSLALVTLAVAPLLGLASGLWMVLTSAYTKKELDAYAHAGSIAEETISAIRTVVAFGCQAKEVDRYTNSLGEAKTVGIKKGLVSGLSIGVLYLCMFGMYGLSFWFGTIQVLDGNIEVGNMMTTFFNILIAAFALGTGASYMEAFSGAKAAGAKIFEVIDRVPEIDIFSEVGDAPNLSSGEIRLNGVEFSYPSRSDTQVLKGISLQIDHGKTTALVGQSGCGKSTIIQLIQRFYDITGGTLTIGGKEIRTLNVCKLRETIGVVAQEPVLFATTIGENIRWGREGVTDQEVKDAAKKANAFSFIEKLPQKFDTLVGEGGGQMSGGQKQRIAIARAIVRNPKILLLDEATSALDTESESVVQAALEQASEGRTTIVIAHRLSTIRNANKIIAFQDGNVAEQGTHDELLKIPDGVYSNLINMQAGRETDENEEYPDLPHDATTVEESKAELQREVSDLEVKLQRKLSGSRRRIRSMSTSSLQRSLSGHRDWRMSTKSNEGVSKASLAGKESEEEEEEEEDLPDIPFSRVFAMNKPEWHYMLAGCFFALIAGSVDPVNAILFSEVLRIFTLSDPDEQRSNAVFYALLFVALGVAAFVAYTAEGLLFGKSGMELTVRLRKRAFHSMLRQDIAYFDDHKNSTGALCTRLSTDASRVQGCTGVRLGTVLKNFCSLGVALGIAFAYGWKLTLLTIAFVPFIVIGGFLEMQLIMGEETNENQAYDKAGQVAVEAISNIRTVASLTKEKVIIERYEKHLEEPIRESTKKTLITGIGYGYSQCVIYFAYAAVFRLGIELVLTGEMTFENVFKVLTAVIFGAMAVGQNSSFAPDYAEAKVSASRMFLLFEREPPIDAYSDSGHKPAHCKGNVTLKSVFFRYPTRPDLPVLKGVDVTVKAGQTLALVGQSGCGKSTSVQLLERFYDAASGQVMIDDCDIKTLNIGWVRQQLGLVSQEPSLFNQSIIENIRYGDCTRTASEEEVKKAAQDANIHNFIMEKLADKYQTNVGAKGGQLSGGQKQRVAIARALLRNPKILLLDEATSALDTESEKVVQEALDLARAGRTSIVIAHRLSTVKNADKIAVIDNGVVAEEGTHDELIAKRGAYFSLVNAQLSDKDKA